MDTTRWDDLETIFEQALALPPDERTAFLDDVCTGNPELRKELDSLLTYEEAASGFFESLAEAVPTPLREQAAPAPVDPYNLIGQTVSHYRVQAKLGGGGMGVVYSAEDIQLGRTVALKFLPPHLHADQQAKQRFIAEAKAASALDHSNICTIYEVDETRQGQLFIAMACYNGQTLKQKIKNGPLPVETALDYAIQITKGLSKAHARGIVHRDVKPANIMVTTDGVVKILDFGLAKISNLQLTKTGTAVGTVAYMSPEQGQGKPVDHRTDFWSLGVVFYEMLAGQQPFSADFEQALLFSIIHTEPRPLSSIRSGLPLRVEHLIEKALAKEPAHRYQHADDLLVDLKAIHNQIVEGPTVAQTVYRPAPSPVVEAPPAPAPAEPQAGPATILVVDDEPELELLMQHKFRRQIRDNTWTFVFARNGAEALEQVQAHPEIELVLTDLNMPEMDGLTLLTKLGEMDHVLKAVVISAYDDMDNIRTAMNRGAFDFVTKPVDFADLETTILKTQHEVAALRQAAEAQRRLLSLENEWQVARRLQETILPLTFPRLDTAEVYAFTAPAREVSGDFYDFFVIEPGRLGFVVGTVSGKGLSAALFTVMCHTLLRAIALQGAAPGACLQHTKDLLFLENLPELTLTVFYGVLDLNTGVVDYCNAGQETPYLLQADGAVARLDSTAGAALNLTEDTDYPTRQTTLPPGAGLFLFTNGLLQTQNPQGTPFSTSRLATLLGQSGDASPAEIIRNMIRAVTQFAGETTQPEDVTLLALRYKGAGE